MRSICKKGSVTLVAVLALCVVASASASASSWHVGGTELASSTPLATSPLMVERITLTTFSPEMECSGVQLKGADIAPSASGQIEHLVFTGCKLISEVCELGSETIESKPLTMTAALGKNSPEDTLVLKAASKSIIAEYKILGNSCALLGTVQLQGTAKLTLPKGREELTEQEIRFAVEEASGELKWQSSGVGINGRVKAKLTSGKAWSFH